MKPTTQTAGMKDAKLTKVQNKMFFSKKQKKTKHKAFIKKTHINLMKKRNVRTGQGNK